MGGVNEPASVDELLERARNVSGLTLRELGEKVSVEEPEDWLRGKGIAGQIL